MFFVKKKIMSAIGAGLALYVGSALPASFGDVADNPAVAAVQISVAEAAEPSWKEDIDEATRDDTMALGVYIGKPMKAFMDEFKSKGWKEQHTYGEGKAIAFQKNKGDYLIAVAAYPYGENKTLVGNYSVRFHVKDIHTADEMYMMAEKNFAYNFGRPNIKRGANNMTWFLNETLSLIVEYNEYDARMALVKGFPYEIVVKRQMGDFKHFFQPAQ